MPPPLELRLREGSALELDLPDTIRALEDAGFRVDIMAGPNCPFASLPMAIADYLEKNAE